jgi:hypothetical protein
LGANDGGKSLSHPPNKSAEKSAFELIEESVHFLRNAPFQLLFSYFIGTIPFIVGFLYFLTDMSQDAFAHRYCIKYSLGLTLLYIWMKSWHSVFASQIRETLHTGSPAWSSQKLFNLVSSQTSFQTSSFFVLPASMLIALPFGWVYAFYHSLSSYGTLPPKQAFTAAWKQAQLWPLQNHILISLITIFGIFVFINTLVLIFAGPFLFKMFFGVETMFTMSGTHVFNTTFFAVALGFSFVCINPIVKTIYALRCYYGESLNDGTDLLADLKRIQNQ